MIYHILEETNMTDRRPMTVLWIKIRS